MKRKTQFSIVLWLLAALSFMNLTGCATIASYIDSSFVASYKKAPYLGAIPKRSPSAMSGSEFIKLTKGMSIEQREAVVLRELRRGNIPDFLRELAAVNVKVKDRDGGTHVGTIWVMPDYLAIGSNADFVRIPMTPMTAQRVADHFGFILPTKKVVDLIYEQAQIKLRPTPLTAGPKMVTNDYIWEHHLRIQQQLDEMKPYQGKLMAGLKKDIVITNRLVQLPRRVAIYGWHQKSQSPIQPLSLVHGNHYADYSHGVRLIAGTMSLDNAEVPVVEVLEDKRIVEMVSDEGVLRITRVVTE
jgi:hypothetical protein